MRNLARVVGRFGIATLGVIISACGSSSDGTPMGSAGSVADAGSSAANQGGASDEGGADNAGASSGGRAGHSSQAGSGQAGAPPSGGAAGASPGAGSGGKTGGSGNGGNAGNSASGGAPPAPSLTWKVEDSSNIYEGVWGSSANDVYAVGRTGRLARSVGDGKWTAQPTATSAHLTGIWGSSATDIYVSVNSNFILHSVGDGTWQHQDYTSGTTFDAVWGSSATDIYVVGPGVVHGTGDGKWTIPPQSLGSGTTFAIWGSSASNIYVARDGSGEQTISHSTGDGKWKAETTPAGPKMQWIWGADATHLYAAGGNVVLFSNGNGVWVADLTLDEAEHFGGLWGFGPDAIYACTSSGHLYRSNGPGRWSAPAVYEPNPTANCYGVWGSGEDNLYLATGKGIYHGTP